MLSPIRQSVASTGETLYLPSGAPKGGVVCLHGSEGGWAGWNDVACALFAANGFAALSHNYTLDYHWPVHPDIDEVPLESTQAALAVMRKPLSPFDCGVGRMAYRAGPAAPRRRTFSRGKGTSSAPTLGTENGFFSQIFSNVTWPPRRAIQGSARAVPEQIVSASSLRAQRSNPAPRDRRLIG